MIVPRDLITEFYQSFQRKDYTRMQSLYHEEATFYDPVFQNLDSGEVKAMWEMLIKASNDLVIQFDNVVVQEAHGSCRWQAWYSFSRTGRPVHNIINASFEFRDNLIFRHRDSFDLWRWTRMAFGPAGIILGWSPAMQSKIRSSAKERLVHFMEKRP